MDSLHGFTLLEIIIVVITLGVISSLGLANYRKLVEQNHCRNTQMNLVRIRNARDVAYAQGRVATSNDIETEFRITLNDPYFQYSWLGGFDSHSVVIASRFNGPSYQCILSFQDLSPLSSTNPSCTNATYCQSVISAP